MGWFGDVEAPEIKETELQKEQLRQAEVQLEDFKTRFKPTEDRYVGQGEGLMSQDYSGYAQTRASAESAQAVADQRRKLGPQVVSSGAGLGNLTGLASTQGRATAAGTGQAITEGQIGIIDRQLNALESGLGLGANISRTTAQAAQSSASRAQRMAQHELQLRTDEAAGKTKLVTDLADAYGGGVRDTGSWNPFEWKSIYDERYDTGERGQVPYPQP